MRLRSCSDDGVVISFYDRRAAQDGFGPIMTIHKTYKDLDASSITALDSPAASLLSESEQ